MNEKLNIQDLIDLLAEKHGMSKKNADSFVKEFLYPEHLRMVGRYNSLFGVVLTVLQEPEAMGKMYGLCEMDRIVVNLL